MLDLGEFRSGRLTRHWVLCVAFGVGSTLSCEHMDNGTRSHHHSVQETVASRQAGAPRAAAPSTTHAGGSTGNSPSASTSSQAIGGSTNLPSDTSLNVSQGGTSTQSRPGASTGAGGTGLVAAGAPGATTSEATGQGGTGAVLSAVAGSTGLSTALATTGGTTTGGTTTALATTGGTTATSTITLPELPEPGLLIAFLGDQGIGVNAEQVLKLIKSEGASAVVHNGDFDYTDNAFDWNDRIDRNLGPNFPYFAVVGNHDANAWDGPKGYGSFIAARLARVPEMHCVGDPGVKAACQFHGVLLLQSCIGSSELTGHGDCGSDSLEQTGFLRHALATRQQLWSVCSWHKNQHDLQVGTKGDEVGWDAYRECQRGGAIINNAHEHSYSRTVGLSDLGNKLSGYGAFGTKDHLEVSPGHSFVFVSGLGGFSERTYDTGHDSDTWWASYSTANRWVKNGQLEPGTASFGATFIRFHVMGDPRLAWGYFKDIEGRIVDEFVITMP